MDPFDWLSLKLTMDEIEKLIQEKDITIDLLNAMKVVLNYLPDYVLTFAIPYPGEEKIRVSVEKIDSNATDVWYITNVLRYLVNQE